MRAADCACRQSGGSACPSVGADCHDSSRIHHRIASDRLYLTFDDGPDLETTPALLDLLGELDVRATFFVSGHGVQAAAGGQMVARMVAEGHAIGNHGLHHVRNGCPDFCTMRKVLYDLSGVVTRLVRAPYGNLQLASNYLRVDPAAHAFQWSLTFGDWRPLDPTQVRVDLAALELKGAIVLLHDGAAPDAAHRDRRQVLGLVRQILTRCERDGVQTGTLSDAFPVNTWTTQADL